MKVTVEGTTEEFLEMAELIAYGRAYQHSRGTYKYTDTTTRNVGDVQAGDDVPNRFREEGV